MIELCTVVHLVFDLKEENIKKTTMKICDLFNINELSMNFDQVKYFSTHTLLGTPTDMYARRVSTGFTAMACCGNNPVYCKFRFSCSHFLYNHIL